MNMQSIDDVIQNLTPVNAEAYAICDNIASKLREYRNDNKMSLNKMSKMFGITIYKYKRIESVEPNCITIDLLLIICSSMNWEMSDFLEL